MKKVKSFNTEGTENTEKTWRLGFCAWAAELFAVFGVENHGDWAYEIQCGDMPANAS
jgi:hypothetical protein